MEGPVQEGEDARRPRSPPSTGWAIPANSQRQRRDEPERGARRARTRPRRSATGCPTRAATGTRVRNVDRGDQLGERMRRGRRVLAGPRPQPWRRHRARGSTARRAGAPDRRRRRRGSGRGRAPAAGGPSATMPPSPTTTIRGIRCAARWRSWRTVTIVRPSRRFRSASRSITSNWWRMSRWTVGSSSRMTGAAWAIATASSTSWRSPSDSSRTSRPTSRPSPTRSIAAATAARSAGRRPRNRSSCGSRPRATTASTVAANGRLDGCGTTAIRRAISSRSSVASDRPSTETLAGRRREDPGHQPEQRRLAGAVRSDDRDPLAGPDRQVDVAEDRPRSVRGRDPAEGEDRLAASPGSRSQLVPALGAAQQDEEERRPDHRGDHPDRDPAEQSARRGRRRPSGARRRSPTAAGRAARSGRRASGRRAARPARRTRSGR